MSLITASQSIQTNNIDTVSGTTTLTIGGTNATAITLSEPVTATGTLNVTGLLSANNVNGIKTNKIDPLLSSNDIVIGAGLGVSNAVYIGKTSGGKGVNFPSGLLTNTIDATTTANDITIGANIDPLKKISIGKSTGLGYGVVFPSGIGTITGLGAIPVKINSSLALPLQVNYIEPNVSNELTIGNTVTGSLTLGGLATGDVYVGGDSTGVTIASNLSIINNQPTDENVFIDTIYVTSASLNIGTKTEYPPSAINIGQTGVTTTIDGSLSLSKLLINASAGTAGQVLTSNGAGNDVTWSAVSGASVLSGETGVLSTLTGAVTYATPFATKPNVTVSLNTNGTSSFIPIGVVSHQTGVGGYTGFTWGSATTSATATITWYATL
jgi:hypothetical protein